MFATFQANAVVIQTLQTVPGLLHNPFVLVAATVEIL